MSTSDAVPGRARPVVRRLVRAACAACAAVLAAGCLAGWAGAQPVGVLPLEDPLHRYLLRQHAAGRLPHAFLAHQPLAAHEARRYLDTLAAHPGGLSAADRVLLARFRGEAPAPGAAWAHRLAPFLYRNGHNLFSVAGDGYDIRVDPLLYVDYGATRGGPSPASWGWARGARVAGEITRHLFFEARLTENAERYPWARFTNHGDSLLVAPRTGVVTLHDGAQGYLTGTGVVGLRTRFFEARFGRDRYRWGPGATSLVLSGYAPVYDHLQLRTTVGPFQYVNLFAGLSEPRLRPPGMDFALPRKYAAFHELTVALPARLQLSFFESVIFGSDSLGARRGFDLSYLNPVLFYRAVERDRGSPDNVMLGAAASWVARPGLHLYTQFLLDELVVSQVGKGWWGNKWGWLFGVQAADVPVPGLSLRLEYARLRPYLYSHRTVLADYVHSDDVLGHPGGPNTEELSLRADYQATPRLAAHLTVVTGRHGRNTPTENYGGDPLVTYATFVRETGVYLLQGVRQRYLLVEADAGYELLPGLLLGAALRAQSLDDAEAGLDWYATPSLLLRWNLPYQSLRY